MTVREDVGDIAKTSRATLALPPGMRQAGQTSAALAQDEDQPSEIALVALLQSSTSDAKQKC